MNGRLDQPIHDLWHGLLMAEKLPDIHACPGHTVVRARVKVDHDNFAVDGVMYYGRRIDTKGHSVFSSGSISLLT